MKNLYLLLRKQPPGYDENDAMVVRASSPTQARELANMQAADEGRIWTDVKLVSCRAIHSNGMAKVILTSFNAG